MKKTKLNLPPFYLIFLIPLVNVLYPYLNNSSRGVNYLITDIDKKIPFVKLFALPYFTWYIFIPATIVYIYFFYENNYYRIIASIILGMLISFLIYYYFQTTVPRPVLNGNDFLTNLLRFIYTMDSPFNCFPSIHVLTCYLMIKGIDKKNESYHADKIIISIIAVTIILSTQFIKQHVILDLISAILLGEIVYRFVGLFSFNNLSKFAAYFGKLHLNIPKVHLFIKGDKLL